MSMTKECIDMKATEVTSPAVTSGAAHAQERPVWLTELSRDLDTLQVLRRRMRIRRDYKGMRIVAEMIRAREEMIGRLDVGNYGGDV